MKTNWKYIGLFLILAIGISGPIHLGYFDKAYRAFSNDWIIKDWVYLIAGFGPFMAGVLTLHLHKYVSNRITILGNENMKYIFIALLPVLTFPVFGLKNSNGINIHFYAFIYALINVIYAFLEEFGWRRYLQNSLEGLNKNWKYINYSIDKLRCTDNE